MTDNFDQCYRPRNGYYVVRTYHTYVRSSHSRSRSRSHSHTRSSRSRSIRSGLIELTPRWTRTADRRVLVQEEQNPRSRIVTQISPQNREAANQSDSTFYESTALTIFLLSCCMPKIGRIGLLKATEYGKSVATTCGLGRILSLTSPLAQLAVVNQRPGGCICKTSSVNQTGKSCQRDN